MNVSLKSYFAGMNAEYGIASVNMLVAVCAQLCEQGRESSIGGLALCHELAHEAGCGLAIDAIISQIAHHEVPLDDGLSLLVSRVEELTDDLDAA